MPVLVTIYIVTQYRTYNKAIIVLIIFPHQNENAFKYLPTTDKNKEASCPTMIAKQISNAIFGQMF